MGIPTFFRWLGKRFGAISVDVIETERQTVNGVEAPIDCTETNPNGIEFDNLYLDMNGIIHPCAHPSHGMQPKNEAEIFDAIFDYIDHIFSLVRPRKVLYMAIDGVAPRAKMNQQRSRRFRAAQERSIKLDKLDDVSAATANAVASASSSSGDAIDKTKDGDRTGAWFDSNCITPGTPFMDRLAKELRFYIAQKLTNDKAWHGLQVILSDSNTPGEGEHKLMAFIRHQRTQATYNPNTRHCIYGLDADLIMLALATHEPHFSILREVISTGAGSRCHICNQTGHHAAQCKGEKAPASQVVFDGATLARKPYQFVQINILREYLESALKPTVPTPFPWDPERAIDDFVFLCFFCGNDFLPHLPSLSIHEGAISMLMTKYKVMLPTLGGFLTNNGKLELARAQQFIQEIAKQEDSIFQRRIEHKRRQAARNKQKREANAHRLNTMKNLGAMSAYQAASQSERQHEALLKQHREKNNVSNKSIAAQLKAQLVSGGEKAHQSAQSVIISKSKKRSRSKGGRVVAKKNVKKQKSSKTTSKTTKHDSDDDNKNSDDNNKNSDDSDDNNSDDNNSDDNDSDSSDDNDDIIRLGEQGYQHRYYKAKFGVDQDDIEFRKNICLAYVQGLIWVLEYYYQGCVSWTWFYPYHYAPFAATLTNFSKYNFDFQPSSPFKPFEQLMGVLPAASCSHLPSCYHELMSDPESPIIDFYPTDFRIDLNGKKQAWQGVALLPFIDEKRLLEAMRSVEDQLTDEERYRNGQRDELLFVSTQHPLSSNLLSLYETNDDQKQQQQSNNDQKQQQQSNNDQKQQQQSNDSNHESSKIQKKLFFPLPSPHSPQSIGGIIFAQYGRSQPCIPGTPVISLDKSKKPLDKHFSLSCFYQLPPVPDGYIFKTNLLPGTILPPKVITPAFLQRSSQFNRFHSNFRSTNPNTQRGRGFSGAPQHSFFGRQPQWQQRQQQPFQGHYANAMFPQPAYHLSQQPRQHVFFQNQVVTPHWQQSTTSSTTTTTQPPKYIQQNPQ